MAAHPGWIWADEAPGRACAPRDAAATEIRLHEVPSLDATTAAPSAPALRISAWARATSAVLATPRGAGQALAARPFVARHPKPLAVSFGVRLRRASRP